MHSIAVFPREFRADDTTYFADHKINQFDELLP